jgi:hypothetical protein
MSEPSPVHIRIEGADTWICLCGNRENTAGFESCDETGKLMEPIEGWPELYLCNQCHRIVRHGSGEIVQVPLASTP